MSDTDAVFARIASLDEAVGRLESTMTRLEVADALVAELAAALRNLLRDTGYGVFTQGPSAAKQAEELGQLPTEESLRFAASEVIEAREELEEAGDALTV